MQEEMEIILFWGQIGKKGEISTPLLLNYLHELMNKISITITNVLSRLVLQNEDVICTTHVKSQDYFDRVSTLNQEYCLHFG